MALWKSSSPGPFYQNECIIKTQCIILTELYFYNENIYWTKKDFFVFRAEHKQIYSHVLKF